jgi:ATP-dependent helicase/nuclease subunit B
MGDSKGPPHVFTIAADQDVLAVLADAVLAGFPHRTSSPDPARLAQTTILVPNRRSAQRLQDIFHARAGAGLILLPRIRPIGDVDEDRLAADQAGDLPMALSDTARLFLVMDLIVQWTEQNADLGIARDLAAGGGQLQALAQSLLELADQAQEDGADLARLNDFYDADIAGHRRAILDLLDVIRLHLPAALHRMDRLDARQRRNALIRAEADRLTREPPSAPVIAAGSTGTFAATRDLLRAIAHLPKGAVVLPGLDRDLDDAAWAAINPQHPQHALKNLVTFLGVKRAAVALLGPEPGPRALLASEVMRPSDTSEQWRSVLTEKHDAIAAARHGLHLLKARDRHLEARAIALLLRRALATPGRTAALITPDRDLARRVKNEMRRWQVTLDDTAGEPLSRFGAAQLLVLIITAAAEGFTPATIVALLQHPLVDLGLGRAAAMVQVERLEMAVLRPLGSDDGLAAISHAITQARLMVRDKSLRSRSASALTEPDWHDLVQFWQAAAAALAPLHQPADGDFATHLARLRQTLTDLAPALDWTLPEHEALALLLADMAEAASFFPPGPFIRAATAVAQRLAAATHRPRAGMTHPRLAIMGLLEARLMRPHVAVLGGLNEGKWPAQPDGGPWLNRPMRTLIGLAQPERAIGQTAHDLVQAMGAEEVHLTWAERIGGEPVGPSRWLLRLQAVVQAAGLSATTLTDTTTPHWAAALDAASAMRPLPRPAPRPPPALRPRRFSVTEVERLIRDPYAIFARKLLQLEPLEALGKPVDAALRGSLFHQIIATFNQAFPQTLPADPEAELLRLGREAFAAHAHDPEVRHFWWPRFVSLARWLAATETGLRQGVAEVRAEIDGAITFTVGGLEHRLHGRADRIDHLVDGRFRIIDYKTGEPPSGKQVEAGLSPQLTLEAAILAAGGFPHLRGTTAEIVFVKASGGTPPGKITNPLARASRTAADLALAHFADFKKLLGAYQQQATPYVPRYRMLREEDESDFDHLSRFAEWRLATPAGEEGA